MNTWTIGKRLAIAIVLRAMPALAFAAAGCAGDEAEVDPAYFDMGARPGMVPSMESLNGVQLNGVQLNGVQLNGVQLNGVQLNGVSLEGPALAGYTSEGQKLAGTALAGAMLTGALADNTTVKIRIDDVVPTADQKLLHYGASIQVGSGAWTSLCGYHDGTPVRAVALAGTWDGSQGTATGGKHVDAPGMITFACRGYSLAKCVEMGYPPWAVVHECKADGTCHDVPGAALHEACVRMLRADYCGDGMPHTYDGTPIDVWDSFDIQAEGATSWQLEAEWTATGARCIGHARWLETATGTTRDYIDAHCSDRWASQQPGYDCGGAGSAFHVENGFSLEPTLRPMLMNRSETHGD